MKYRNLGETGVRVFEVSLGARRTEQVEDNLAAGMPPVSEESVDRIREVYDRHVCPEVHHLW